MIFPEGGKRKMNRNVKSALFQGLIKFAFFAAACVLLAALGSFAALGQKARGEKAANEVRESQPPLYRDYKGVSIGMTAEEARARLGKPMTKGDDQDFYVISEKETVQVCRPGTRSVGRTPNRLPDVRRASNRGCGVRRHNTGCDHQGRFRH